MDTIVCIVGESGSGKTTIAKLLEKKGYNIIYSYTTREPREPNEWGHTFVKGMVLTEIQDIVAFQKLYDYNYWATREQYEGKGTSIYVIDPLGVNQVQDYVRGKPDVQTKVIYLKADETERIIRLSETRTRLETETRIKKDRKMFSFIKADYVVDANKTVTETLELVEKAIEEGV